MADTSRLTRHVVLAKPGDVLLLGNVGEDFTPETAHILREFFGEAGIQVAIFTEDIDVGGLEEHEVLMLISEENHDDR